MERVEISNHIFLINEELKRQIRIFKENQLLNLSSEEAKELFLREFEKIERVVEMLDNWFLNSLINL